MKYSSFSPERKREESKRKSVFSKEPKSFRNGSFLRTQIKKIIVNIVDFYQKIITCII